MTSTLRACVAATAALLLLASCATGSGDDNNSGSANAPDTSGFQLAQRIKDRLAAGEDLRIVVSAPNTSLSFAKPQRDGVEQANADLDGVEASFIGPSDGNADGQINELRTLISQAKADAIALSSVSNDALKPVIADAYNAGIPLISYSTSNTGSKQLGFIGTDVAAGGTMEGAELTKLLGGKGGTVVTFSVAPEAAWSNTRFEALKAALPSNVTLLKPVNTGAEPAQMYTAIQNAMTAHRDAVAIASLDCCSFGAAAKWVNENAGANKPYVVGFDAIQQTIDYIKSGVVSFAISQQPKKLVFEAVKMLRDYIADGTELGTKMLPLVLVTRDNIDSVTPEG
jgi:simple sugar transport system substrate-binding protein